MHLQKTLWTLAANHHLHPPLPLLLPSLHHSALPLALSLLANLRSEPLNQVHSALQPLAHPPSPLRSALLQRLAKLLPRVLPQARLALRLRLVNLLLAPPQSFLHLVHRLSELLVFLRLGKVQHRLDPPGHQMPLRRLPLLVLLSRLLVVSVRNPASLQRSDNQALDRQLLLLFLANHLPHQRLGESLHLVNRPLVRLTSLRLPRLQLLVRLPPRLLSDKLASPLPLPPLHSARHHHLRLASLINLRLLRHPLLVHQLQQLLLSLGSGLNQQ